MHKSRSLAHPGTLPKPNKKVIEYAETWTCFKCDISTENQYARKNYYYMTYPRAIK